MVLYFHLLNRPISAAWNSAATTATSRLLAKYPFHTTAGSCDDNSQSGKKNNEQNTNKTTAQGKPVKKNAQLLLKMKMSKNIEIDKVSSSSKTTSSTSVFSRGSINKANAKPLTERAYADFDKVAKLTNPQNPTAELHTLYTPIRKLEENKRNIAAAAANKERDKPSPQVESKEQVVSPKESEKVPSKEQDVDNSLKCAFASVIFQSIIFIIYISSSSSSSSSCKKKLTQ
jgi:hypothetical protein